MAVDVPPPPSLPGLCRVKIGEKLVKRKAAAIVQHAPKNAAKNFMNTEIDALSKQFCGSAITLTNTEIEDIIKVIGSLEDRRIFLKGFTRKILCQEGGFLNFLDRLMRTRFPIMNNALTPLGKNLLTPLGLTAATSAVDAAIKKKFLGSGMTVLIILNEEMDDIMKIVQSLEESGLLVKDVSEIIKNTSKKQKR